MKGVIVVCLADMVKEKLGNEMWTKALEHAGLPKTKFYTPSTNVDDNEVMALIEGVCKNAKMTVVQAADAFGDYWVNVYAPKVYKTYYRGVTNSKDMLLKLDKIHQTVTERIPDAKPPKFKYSGEGDKVLTMKYISSRGMMVFFEGLVKGVGKHFNENLKITKLGNDTLKVTFP